MSHSVFKKMFIAAMLFSMSASVNARVFDRVKEEIIDTTRQGLNGSYQVASYIGSKAAAATQRVAKTAPAQWMAASKTGHLIRWSGNKLQQAAQSNMAKRLENWVKNTSMVKTFTQFLSSDKNNPVQDLQKLQDHIDTLIDLNKENQGLNLFILMLDRAKAYKQVEQEKPQANAEVKAVSSQLIDQVVQQSEQKEAKIEVKAEVKVEAKAPQANVVAEQEIKNLNNLESELNDSKSVLDESKSVLDESKSVLDESKSARDEKKQPIQEGLGLGLSDDKIEEKDEEEGLDHKHAAPINTSVDLIKAKINRALEEIKQEQQAQDSKISKETTDFINKTTHKFINSIHQAQELAQDQLLIQLEAQADTALEQSNKKIKDLMNPKTMKTLYETTKKVIATIVILNTILYYTPYLSSLYFYLGGEWWSLNALCGYASNLISSLYTYLFSHRISPETFEELTQFHKVKPMFTAILTKCKSFYDAAITDGYSEAKNVCQAFYPLFNKHQTDLAVEAATGSFLGIDPLTYFLKKPPIVA